MHFLFCYSLTSRKKSLCRQDLCFWRHQLSSASVCPFCRHKAHMHVADGAKNLVHCSNSLSALCKKWRPRKRNTFACNTRNSTTSTHVLNMAEKSQSSKRTFFFAKARFSSFPEFHGLRTAELQEPKSRVCGHVQGGAAMSRAHMRAHRSSLSRSSRLRITT